MGLRKGDEALIFNNGFVIAAIIVEVLSPTRAIARAMEGLFAGEEVEADFPVGRLEPADVAPADIHVVRI